jgi:hypothetical protein
MDGLCEEQKALDEYKTHHMVMTVYEFLNTNRRQYRKLVSVGVVSWLLERDLNLYETYQRELSRSGSKMQAASQAAHDFKISERAVFTIVKKYSQEITEV